MLEMFQKVLVRNPENLNHEFSFALTIIVDCTNTAITKLVIESLQAIARPLLGTVAPRSFPFFRTPGIPTSD